MDDFDPQKLEQLSQAFSPAKLQALGLPTSLSPATAATALIGNLVPNLGGGILRKIGQRLSGTLTGGSGIFGKVFKIIIRVIDAILGVLVGVIGGAILGAGAVGFAGLTGGLSGIAQEPTTIHVNSRDGDNFVIHGDKAHEKRGFGTQYNQGNYSQYQESNSNKNNNRNNNPDINPSKPTRNYFE